MLHIYVASYLYGFLLHTDQRNPKIENSFDFLSFSHNIVGNETKQYNNAVSARYSVRILLRRNDFFVGLNLRRNDFVVCLNLVVDNV